MVHYLFLTWDKFPTPRIEVDAIFVCELSRRGHRIDWLLQADEGWDRRSGVPAWEGSRVWIAPTIAGTSRLRLVVKHLLDLWNDLKLFRLMRRNSYDFVLVKDKFLSALLALVAARRRGIRFIYWLSYPFPESWLYKARENLAPFPWFNRFRGWLGSFLLYRTILPRADHVFVQSEAMKDDICTHGISPRKLTPVPMGVRLERIPYPYPGSRVLKPEGERWIVYLGTLTRVRKLDLLLRALARVREQAAGAVLCFVGGGDVEADEEHLRQEARRLGLADEVRITGWVDRDLAWEYAAAADVCVSPYLSTPILASTSPTKLFEYMALGRPVVASEHPEQGRVIRDSGAGACVPFEEEAFAQAIVELLNDVEAAEEKGRRGRRWVETHRSYTAIAQEVERCLARIVADPAKVNET